jgi:hypothetical protein
MTLGFTLFVSGMANGGVELDIFLPQFPSEFQIVEWSYRKADKNKRTFAALSAQRSYSLDPLRPQQAFATSPYDPLSVGLRSRPFVPDQRVEYGQHRHLQSIPPAS